MPRPAAGAPTAASVPAQVAHIARDPLDPAFRDAAFRDALARKDSAIKRVLLDQTVVSGVGNIYADESLWAARIHPETPARALSTRAVNRLLAEVRAVLEKALAEGGTSFDAQYVNVNGQAGLLRALPERLRPHRPAVPAVRPADRARVVHEPVEPLLPALPAAPRAESGEQLLPLARVAAPAVKPIASLIVEHRAVLLGVVRLDAARPRAAGRASRSRFSPLTQHARAGGRDAREARACRPGARACGRRPSTQSSVNATSRPVRDVLGGRRRSRGTRRASRLASSRRTRSASQISSSTSSSPVGASVDIRDFIHAKSSSARRGRHLPRHRAVVRLRRGSRARTSASARRRAGLRRCRVGCCGRPARARSPWRTRNRATWSRGNAAEPGRRLEAVSLATPGAPSSLWTRRPTLGARSRARGSGTSSEPIPSPHRSRRDADVHAAGGGAGFQHELDRARRDDLAVDRGRGSASIRQSVWSCQYGSAPLRGRACGSSSPRTRRDVGVAQLDERRGSRRRRRSSRRCAGTTTGDQRRVSGIQHLLPRARVRRRHEPDRLVDVEHVAVLLGVERRDARRLGHELAPAQQVRALHDRAEPVAAVLLEHEGAVLLRRRRCDPRRSTSSL